jgi:hypothetical protein
MRVKAIGRGAVSGNLTFAGSPVTIRSDSIPWQSRLPRAPPDGNRRDERWVRGVSYNEQKVHN